MTVIDPGNLNILNRQINKSSSRNNVSRAKSVELEKTGEQSEEMVLIEDKINAFTRDINSVEEEVDYQKVETIKEQIAQEEYEVDSNKIAEAIVGGDSSDGELLDIFS